MSKNGVFSEYVLDHPKNACCAKADSKGGSEWLIIF